MPFLIGWKSISYLKWSFIRDSPIFALVRPGSPLTQDGLETLSGYLDSFRPNNISALHIISRPYHYSHAELVRTARRLGILTVLEMEYDGDNLPDSDTQSILDGIVYSITADELKALDPPSMNGINDGRTYIRVTGAQDESADASRKLNQLEKRGISVHWMQDGSGPDNRAVRCLGEAFALSEEGGIYLPCWLGTGERDTRRFYLGANLQDALAAQRRELKRQRRHEGVKTPCTECEFNRLDDMD